MKRDDETRCGQNPAAKEQLSAEIGNALKRVGELRDWSDGSISADGWIACRLSLKTHV
jgi:hypothetical protein